VLAGSVDLLVTGPALDLDATLPARGRVAMDSRETREYIQGLRAGILGVREDQAIQQSHVVQEAPGVIGLGHEPQKYEPVDRREGPDLLVSPKLGLERADAGH
jgi:hypothetical protein